MKRCFYQPEGCCTPKLRDFTAEQSFGCDARALFHSLHFRPHDIFSHPPIPAAVPKPQSAPAIMRRGSPITRATRSESLGHDFRMLDEIRHGIDNARNEILVVGQWQQLETAVFVRVPGICEWQNEGADIRLPNDRQDFTQRHVEVVRALVIAPTDMQPNAVAWQVAQALLMAATTNSQKRRKSESDRSR